MLRDYTRQWGFLSLAALFIALCSALVAAWGIVGAKLARMAGTMMKIKDGRFTVKVPDTHHTDELGEFARTVQHVANELERRERVHGTYDKLKSKKVRTLLESGKLNLTGEKSQAFVLTVKLGGMTEAASHSDPVAFVRVMNSFYQKIYDLVLAREGVLDQIGNGVFTIYWGLPIASEQDADHAFGSALEIRDLVKELNAALKKARITEVTVQMGLHFGPVVGANFGGHDRQEYTVLGNGVEVSYVALAHTEQYATDFLATGQAVDHAPKWYPCEATGSTKDEVKYELFELRSALDRSQFPEATVNEEELTDTQDQASGSSDEEELSPEDLIEERTPAVVESAELSDEQLASLVGAQAESDSTEDEAA